MSTSSSAVGDSSLGSREGVDAREAPTRPWYWSVRRELWENRSLHVAPLAAAGVVLLGFCLSLITLPHRMRGTLALEPERQRAALIMPFSMAAVLIMVTTVLVAVFYCLDALHGERRDRSILFWKSLPVSDRTAVLAKAAVPLLVLPLQAAVLVAAVQVVMLLLSTVVLLASGSSPAALWSAVPIVQLFLIQLYGLAVHALWHAPLYAWLLLVSAWARRTPFLWAVLPPAAIGAVGRLAFGMPTQFCSLMEHRLVGAYRLAFDPGQPHGLVSRLAQLEPGRFLGSAGLWLGLAVAAAFLAAAVRLRRQRGPI
jgi:ABC-2 type transport system permease protein